MPNWISTILNNLIPDELSFIFANQKISKRLTDWKTDANFDSVKKLSEKQLKEYLESEWGRAKELDEKLTKLTATLSVAVTISGTLAKTIVDGLSQSPLRIPILIALSLSIILLLLGALIGFNGLRPKARYGYGADFILKTVKSGKESKETLEYAVCGFQCANQIRSNEASAAILFIRDGIVALTVGIFLSILSPTNNQDIKRESRTAIAPSIYLKCPDTSLQCRVKWENEVTHKNEINSVNGTVSK